jgi:hypothetical protein
MKDNGDAVILTSGKRSLSPALPAVLSAETTDTLINGKKARLSVHFKTEQKDYTFSALMFFISMPQSSRTFLASGKNIK